MTQWIYIVGILCMIATFIASCEPDNGGPTGATGSDLTDIPYNPQGYNLELPDTYSNLVFDIPEDNQLTVDGVQLGRHLFYDPIMSIDSTVSCSSCHGIRHEFTDPRVLSRGVNGLEGKRHSMSLLNIGYVTTELFWDGRAKTLEEQVVDPILSDVEFDHSITGVEERLRRSAKYREMFRKAFGIRNSDQIDIDLTSKAVAQFERIIISGGNAKFDQYLRDEYFFTDEEENGFAMFFDTNEDIKDAECAHCHVSPLFTTDDFVNNGLQCPDDDMNFPDNGRGLVTGARSDNGKMRIPHLRNIALSAPYMHDGRFNTLEEVLAHYSSGGCVADNLDGNMRKTDLNPDEINDLVAFLHTLTDTTFYNNPDLQSPFE